MTPGPVPGSRSARLRILLPIATLVAGLAVFLALFWHPGGSGRKGHSRSSSAAERDRSPIGSSSGGGGNSRATVKNGGGSPQGEGASRFGSGEKGEIWWYRDGKSRQPPEDVWWSPEKGGRKAHPEYRPPPGGSAHGAGREPIGKGEKGDRETRPADKPAYPSPMNPGEAAGQKGGPDDFWWRD